MSIKTVISMVDWVEDNIASNPTLAEMSEYVGYSEFYCSAKFHEFTGMTYKKYLLKRKLALSAIDLSGTDHRILDIAMKYGFSSHEAFFRAFRKEYGCTPCEYRIHRPNIILYPKAEFNYLYYERSSSNELQYRKK